MQWLQVILFAAAVSVDGLGAGASYGLRRVLVPLQCIALISLLSAGATAVAMVIGSEMAAVLPPGLVGVVGGTILVGVGLWILRKDLDGEPGVVETTRSRGEDTEPTSLFSVRIRSVGLVVSVMREPSRADLDLSGTISSKEACVLGTALAMDAFAGGFGAALAGLPQIPTAVTVGLVKFVLVNTGLYLGDGSHLVCRHRLLRPIPGAILIILGVFSMVR